MSRNRNKSHGSSNSGSTSNKPNGGKPNEQRSTPNNSGERRTESDTGSSASSGEADNKESTDKGKDKRSVAKTNDPAWYAYSAEMLLTVANLPFSDALGVPVDTGFRRNSGMITTNTLISPTYQQYAIPGIASYKIKPTVGYANTISDAVNVAATALYTHVRVVNSGRKNYDATDLMMYALTIADLYSMIQWCKRIYACAFMYSQRNMYIGKELLNAQNVDYNDIVRNLANFATWLNTFISKVAVYAIPNSINYFKRKVFMYSSVYLENPDGNIKDAIYQFVPDGFYKFKLDTNNVGMLEYVKATPPGGSEWTFARIATYLDGFLNAIYGDEDFALMSGDIIKAYGTELFGLQELGVEEAVSFGYDADVLYQMKNADIVHVDSTYTVPTYTDVDGNARKYGDIYQDSHGNLLCREGINCDNIDHQYDILRNRFIDSDLAMPSPLNVIESTRLQVAFRQTVSNNWVEIDTGVDYVTEIDIRYAEDYASNASYGFHNGMVYTRSKLMDYSLLTPTQIRDAFIEMIWMSQFRYCPNMFEVEVTVDSNSIVNVDTAKVTGNVENYCWFATQQLARMHHVALLSLFWVPGIAKLVNFGKAE